MPALPRLLVLPPSHFSERARWGLQHAGIAFAEEAHAPLFHIRPARRVAKRSALPLLVTGDGEAVQGSGRILDWTGLPGGDGELERRFEKRIGPLVRQYVYAGTLHDPDSGVREMLAEGVPDREARWTRRLWPLTRRLMMRGLDARPALLPELEAAMEAELHWFAERLGGRRFLVGDAFGRADITAASLLAPLACPAAMPIYRRVRMPPAIEAAVARWDAPTLRWVRDTYAAHRSER